MTDNKRIALNTFYLYVRMFVLLVVSFYTTRVVLNSLGVNDFGLYNVVAGFVAMISFVNTSISNSIQRFLNFEIGKGAQGDVNRYFSVAILTQVITSLIVIILAETVGLWFLNNKLNIPSESTSAAHIVYQISIITVVFRLLQSPFQAIIIAKERMKFYAYMSLFEAFLQLGIAFLLGYMHSCALEIYAALLLVITIILFGCNVIYSRRIHAGLSLRPRYQSKIFKEIFSFCGWNLLGSASGVVMNQGINMLMNIFFGVTVNAARGIASQVYAGVQRFIANFQLAMNPQIVQSYAAGDRDRYLQLCYANFKVSVYLMWIIALPLIICCEEVLSIWLGDNVPSDTIIFVNLVLITGVVEALGSSISVPIYATGNIRNYQLYVSIVRLLSLPIAYLIYKLGYPAFSSMLVCLVIDIVAQYLRVVIWTKEVKISAMYYVKTIVIPLIFVMFITCALSYVIYIQLPFQSNLLKVVVITLTTLAINVPSILFIALSRNERKRIVSVVRKKLFNR